MEKWKIGVIVALLAGLIGYGALQQSPSESAAPPEAVTDASSEPPAFVATTEPSESAQRFMGQSLAQTPDWNSVKQWVNTPQPLSKASVQGEVALVEVFRIGCSHCEQAIPFMEALYERYAPRGLKMVAIHSPGAFDDPGNPENDWNTVQSWLKERGVKYPVGFDARSAWFQGRIKGDRYPTLLLFDQKGKVALAHTGFDAAKATSFAIALEKRLPGQGSVEERARELAKWLTSLYGTAGNENWQNEAAQQIETQLKS